MLLRYQHIIQKLLITTLILSVAIMVYFFTISPIALQKAMVITPVDSIPIERYIDSSVDIFKAPDVRKLLKSIPYQSGKAIYDVFPPDRYQRAIVQGYGNCSNLTFGMAYYLLKQGYSFQVVHFIPYDGFLTGNGHTLLSMPFVLNGQGRAGLVDIMEGGIPMLEGKIVDLNLLLQKHLGGVSISSMNARKDTASPYYDNFLNNSAVGVVPSYEVQVYFDFINNVYISFGSKRLERIVYSGLGIVLNKFPHTYVSREEYARLFTEEMGLLYAAKILICLLRLIPLLTLSLIVLSLLNMKRLYVLRRDKRPVSHFKSL